MGGGNYDPDQLLAAAARRKLTKEDDFDYSIRTQSQPQEEWKCHPLLDPRGIKGVREGRDSDEHPTTLAIMVFFDETGSMRMIPRFFQQELNNVMAVIKGKSGVEHPQILVGAHGDTTCDKVPFQIGQFESDNRIDEQLRLIFLEGDGGPLGFESYGLAHYAAGWKTSIDCWEKRRQKGLLFTIGDEMPWPTITREEIYRIFGDTVKKDIPIEEAIAKTRERYRAFHIIVSDGKMGKDPKVEKVWRSLLGERVLRLDDPRDICNLIASKIAELKIDDQKSPATDKTVKADKKADPKKRKGYKI